MKKVDSQMNFPAMEHEVLAYWKQEKIFERSVGEKPARLDSHSGGDTRLEFVFYDGPPFATGLPHYGHLVPGLVKDIFPRYKTMRGYRVERQWGWDCHGLPIENIVEKELGFKSKKDIEAYGIEKFNELCRTKVLSYTEEWKKTMERFGRFVDMDNAYLTMDRDYMESVWWVFKSLWDKGLVYESYRTMHICPRCETTLSQQEVSEGYQDVKDLAVTAKFELTDEPGTYMLAWTTTPWTLPGNVALAVGKDITYVKVRTSEIKKKVYLISGKHAYASQEYFPRVKNELEASGYEVTIIDHVKSEEPTLQENLANLASFDFSGSHIVTNSLAASTILKFLNDTDVQVESLTMIAPSYPGRVNFSTDQKWVAESGYDGFEIDFEMVKKRVREVEIIYSNDEVIRVENIELLGKNLAAKMYKEDGKEHFFSKEYMHEPDFQINFSECFIVAKELVEKVFAGKEYELGEEFTGETLLGKSYTPPFQDYYQNQSLENHANGWKIYHADFVTTEMGTGIAHEAPAFGEDDMALGKLHNLPWVQHVAMDGTMKPEVSEFAGMQVKPIENSQAFDIEIIKSLAGKGLLFSKEKYEHSYPHCWRCDTPLLNYATSSWFVAVEKVKEDALAQAKNINWSPEHIKEGRFGKWLEGARDWSVSRQRFWASCIPLWVCGCGAQEVIGSVAELEAKCGKEVSDLHKHTIDTLTWDCKKCGGEMKRIPDVLDTWFDSGSMPYASKHYMGEGELGRYPADFISESLDQTRAWFYYLHVLGVALTGKNAFENCNVNGIVLAEDGKKMSKKLQNYPDVNEVIEKYGADALRMYLVTSPVVNAENLNFTEKDLASITKNTFRMLWNSYSFFTTYATLDNWSPNSSAKASENILDRWLLSELQGLIVKMTEELDVYKPAQAARLIAPFVDDLSNWYIRRSRKRFWKNENDEDKNDAYQTLYTVLVELAKLMAPFTPFVSEEIYRNLTGEESVHLAEWPKNDSNLVYEKLQEDMKNMRAGITQILQARSDSKINVRRPLKTVSGPELDIELQEILKDEVNVKEYVVSGGSGYLIDVSNPEEFILEEEAREIIRVIQQGRKSAKFNVEDRIILGYQGKEYVFLEFEEMIKKEVLAVQILNSEISDADYSSQEKVGSNGHLKFFLKRV